MKKNVISLIVAAAENNAIGKDNDLMWHLPTDMKYFKDTTTGHCVIMGRKNYDSIPEKYRPLPQRTNIVVSRQIDFKAPGCLVVGSIEEAIEKAKSISGDEIFIIGGAQIYAQSIPFADKIYLTRVHKHFDGDTFFPAFNTQHYLIKSSLYVQQDSKNPFSFTFQVYEKKIS